MYFSSIVDGGPHSRRFCWLNKVICVLTDEGVVEPDYIVSLHAISTSMSISISNSVLQSGNRI